MSNKHTLKNYTRVTYILANDTVTSYFEGNATLQQVNSITGFCPIIEFERVKGNFQADYVKAKNLFGYTAY